MIHKHYNSWQITNSCEKEADKQLSLPGDSDELMYVIHNLRITSRYHKTQMADECDFVNAIQKYLVEKDLKNIFFGKMVCFPECGFNMKGIGEDNLWHRDHELN
jgi:hypothetical protein